MVAGDQTTRLLVLRLDGRSLGIELAWVRELLRTVRVTPIPGAPQGVEGIIDAGGELIPVLDLRSRFGLPDRPVHLSDLLAVLELPGRRVAVRVSAADEVLELAPEDLRELRPLMSASGHVLGVARLPSGLVSIHDPEAFLSSEDAVRLDEALSMLTEGLRA